MSIESKLRDFIITNFLFGDADVTVADDDSLLDRGIIDSSGVLELVGFLDENFDIEIRDDELVPGNFDSINKLSAFITRKGGARDAA